MKCQEIPLPLSEWIAAGMPSTYKFPQNNSNEPDQRSRTRAQLCRLLETSPGFCKLFGQLITFTYTMVQQSYVSSIYYSSSLSVMEWRSSPKRSSGGSKIIMPGKRSKKSSFTFSLNSGYGISPFNMTR